MTEKKFTEADVAAVMDNPEWTDEELARAVPFKEAFPDLAATIRRRGPQATPTKEAVSIRLDADLVARLRAGGRGWQSRVNAILRRAVLG